MSDDVKAAAERLLSGIELSDPYSIGDIYFSKKDGASFSLKDIFILAESYLAEHPADDCEPITEEWLRSVGFSDGATGESLWLRCKDSQLGHLRHTAMALDLITGNWTANGLGCKECKTRGDVRRLAAALGIALKEGGVK
jgi:hypothetical protein